MRNLIAIFLLSFLTTALASTNVDGSFEANNSCPAYISKNKKTNPDDLLIQPNTTYKLLEINRQNNPDWLRIVVPDNQFSQRWVSANCGVATYQHPKPQSCELSPGLANSYIIALSWQPGFCETYGYEAGKAECRHLSANSYSASHLVLHGLWPNQDACGDHYGFCTTVPKTHHCDYAPLNLSEPVASVLKGVMPGFAFGSCLERHEWNKHGSCQFLSTDDYFAMAARLTSEADQTALGIYLHDHRGQQVTRTQLQERAGASFGTEAISKVYFGCKNGVLVDIFIQLPALLAENESLVALVKKAPEYTRYEGCPERISISDFNSEPAN
ncbi:MAG: ribonuclease T [Legionella sp.]|nr:ribonuclease T [Legionella sp.]